MKNTKENNLRKDKYTTRKEVLTSFFLSNEYSLATRKQIIALFLALKFVLFRKLRIFAVPKRPEGF